MVTVEDPRLAQIRALCTTDADRPDHWRGQDYMDGRAALAEAVLDILGAPPVAATPPQGDVLDALTRVVEKAVPNGEDDDGFILGYAQGTGAIHNAIKVLQDYGITARPSGFEVQDRPTPPQGIDPDALGALLDREGDLYDVDLGPLGPKILALVRPIEGVVLTPEEARMCASCGSTNNNGISCFACGRSDTDE